jgi:hypothetical protein
MPQMNSSQGMAVRGLTKTIRNAAAVAIVVAVPALGIANMGFGLFSHANSSDAIAAEQVASKDLLALDGPAATARRVRLAEKEANSNLPAQAALNQESAVELTNFSLTATKINSSPTR